MLTPSRLTLARKRRGLSLVQLAAATQVSVRSLSGYENGRQEPSQDTLSRLAAALDVPVGFLQAGDVDDIPVDAISFRALTKLTAGQRDTARSAGRIALMLAEWIEQRFHLPGPDVPSLPTLDPETAAEVVRACWGLGVAPRATSYGFWKPTGCGSTPSQPTAQRSTPSPSSGARHHTCCSTPPRRVSAADSTPPTNSATSSCTASTVCPMAQTPNRKPTASPPRSSCPAPACWHTAWPTPASTES